MLATTPNCCFQAALDVARSARVFFSVCPVCVCVCELHFERRPRVAVLTRLLGWFVVAIIFVVKVVPVGMLLLLAHAARAM